MCSKYGSESCLASIYWVCILSSQSSSSSSRLKQLWRFGSVCCINWFPPTLGRSSLFPLLSVLHLGSSCCVLVRVFSVLFRFPPWWGLWESAIWVFGVDWFACLGMAILYLSLDLPFSLIPSSVSGLVREAAQPPFGEFLGSAMAAGGFVGGVGVLGLGFGCGSVF